MNTITVKELLQNFENQEFVQITLPKGASDDTILHMRSKVQSIDHFNEVYKDGNKFYLEDNTDACARICKRAFGGKYGENYDINDYDNAEYCLYLANGDLREAVKLMKERYC